MNDTVCKYYEDFDFYPEFNEDHTRPLLGDRWDEMSYYRYTKSDRWNTEPSEWDLFLENEKDLDQDKE